MPGCRARQPCYTTASFSTDRAFTQVTSLEVDATPPINYNGRTVTFQLDRLSNGTFTFDDVSVARSTLITISDLMTVQAL